MNVQSVLGKSWQTLVRTCRHSACGLVRSFPRVRHRPPSPIHTHTTRRVVSKVFPTDFASRKVRTVETVWNEAYFGTLNAHSQAQESRCCKCERRLRRPRQRTKKRALLRRTVKAHCVLTSYCGRSNASPGRQKGEKNIC